MNLKKKSLMALGIGLGLASTASAWETFSVVAPSKPAISAADVGTCRSHLQPRELTSEQKRELSRLKGVPMIGSQQDPGTLEFNDEQRDRTRKAELTAIARGLSDQDAREYAQELTGSTRLRMPSPYPGDSVAVRAYEYRDRLPAGEAKELAEFDKDTAHWRAFSKEQLLRFYELSHKAACVPAEIASERAKQASDVQVAQWNKRHHTLSKLVDGTIEWIGDIEGARAP